MPQRTSSLRNSCILLFGIVHLLFLAVSVLPRNWRDGRLIGKLTDAYESATTCLQNWAMFYTIPAVHKLDAHLLVQAPGQPPQRIGMVLPGLHAYPQPEHTRFYGWMHMVILSTERADQREPYMRRSAVELMATRRFPAATQFSLVVDTHYTRSLAGVRKLREIATLKQTAMGPFRLEDLAASKPPSPAP